jgi:hypothetical protein
MVTPVQEFVWGLEFWQEQSAGLLCKFFLDQSAREARWNDYPMAPQINWHSFLTLRVSVPPGLFDEGMGNSLGERLRTSDEL